MCHQTSVQNLQVFSAHLSRISQHLADISYAIWNWKGSSDHYKCSGPVYSQLACILWLARMANQKQPKLWPKCLLKINSDQNICVFLFLNVHLKIVDHSIEKYRENILFAHIFPIWQHTGNQTSSSMPLIHMKYILSDSEKTELCCKIC